MKLYFYNQLLYGGKLTDMGALPREEQERITQHNRYLERCLGVLRCPLHPGVTSRVLPEWNKGRIRKGKIRFSLFTCCPGHAFDMQKTMRRLSLRGECLAGTYAGLEADYPPPQPSFILLPVFRSLLEAICSGRRNGRTHEAYGSQTQVPEHLTA